MHTKAKGNIAEEKGCEYLREHGYRIVERNVYNRFGEIDIIALKDNVLHFVEVKSAQSYEQYHLLQASKTQPYHPDVSSKKEVFIGLLH